MTDDPGRPQEARTAPDAEHAQLALSLTTAQAASQLGVDSRTVRRWITEGLRTAGGTILRLQARQVRTGRGPEYQIYQHDLEAFKEQRDHDATEGQAAGQLARPAAEESQSQALTTLTASINLLGAELERRTLALSQAQETIERLAREAGRQAGRSEELERECDALRQRVAELEQERDRWQQQARAKKNYRIRLFPIEE